MQASYSSSASNAKCSSPLVSRTRTPSPIFDYGRTHDGVFYRAMELLDGATLQRIVAVGGPQPPGKLVRILSMACGARAELTAANSPHRHAAIHGARIHARARCGRCSFGHLRPGAVAYFLLAGTDVFSGTSVLQVLSQHIHQTPEPLSERGLSVQSELEAIVLACLEQRPRAPTTERDGAPAPA